MCVQSVVGTMSETAPGDAPHPSHFADTFDVYEVESTADAVRYYGEPRSDHESVVRAVAPLFRDRGYTVSMEHELGEYALVARERSVGIDGFPTTNVILFLATVLTTLFAGSQWYGIDTLSHPARIVEAWPFTVAVLGVLGVHELGHYVASRYHDVQASLPYFLPLPTLLGTMGAVIRMNDTLPDRKSLFDIGVAGPLAGLGATVIVTAVGVTLPPVEVGAFPIQLGYPPLIQLIAAALGEQLVYADASLMANPVVVGGWVGAFVTFLNLLPVGQLDGGHIVRAMFGRAHGTIQRLVPAALFGLGAYLYAFGDGQSVSLWVVWGFLTLFFARMGSAEPLDDSALGASRLAIGGLTLLLGVLSFTPVPLVLT
ncbi:membrane-associated Zn-dependent protease [Halogeometricum borinquense DSM 11551]|uniref:Membrane-associated Zn-dependent protease n=2 Tax=Halogeometricum borinquense (strain ATCC 700274 / DSM 11551 / JCM 10706 / KCTC 4070 / PR3) TaxID=469382 RepID=L9UMP9_HALBP|nr:membrane-associated Zn-dependent protease [Halogeometricum borinquense DSM 11551]